MLAEARLAQFGGRLHLRQGSFAEITRWASEVGWGQVEGVLLDLGLSSIQVDNPDRGFSFRTDGPLDMRFDPTQPLTAADLVNGLSEAGLAEVLSRYGEEPRARAVARAIVAARPLSTTAELAEVVAGAAGRGRGRIHPATRVFQALRIEVNQEMEALQACLPQAVKLLVPGGRIAVIAFHSLEDRQVKAFFRRESRDCICPPRQPTCTCGHQASLRVLTPRPIRPDEAELRVNPRARSARLRIAERLTSAWSLQA